MLNFRFCVFFIFVLMLAACSSQQKQTAQPEISPQEEHILVKVERLLIEQQYLDAQDTLNSIDIFSLSELEQTNFYWLKAQLSVYLGRGDDAITAMNAVPPGAFGQLGHVDPNAPGF